MNCALYKTHQDIDTSNVLAGIASNHSVPITMYMQTVVIVR